MTTENTTKENTDTYDDLGKIKQDETKKVDYLAVCAFMYLISDSVITLRDFSDALEKSREVMIDGETDEISVSNKSRALFAKSMVDNFLCRPEEK